jgi:hypothetical protein
VAVGDQPLDQRDHLGDVPVARGSTSGGSAEGRHVAVEIGGGAAVMASIGSPLSRARR